MLTLQNCRLILNSLNVTEKQWEVAVIFHEKNASLFWLALVPISKSTLYQLCFWLMCHGLAIDISCRINTLFDESLKYTQESFMPPTIQWELYHWLQQLRLNLFWTRLKILNRTDWHGTLEHCISWSFLGTWQTKLHWINTLKNICQKPTAVKTFTNKTVGTVSIVLHLRHEPCIHNDINVYSG